MGGWNASLQPLQQLPSYQPSCHLIAAAHCYLAGHDGLRQGRSYYVVVQRRSGASAAVELVWILPGGGPWPKLERVRVGGGWSCLQTSKDEEEAPAPAAAARHPPLLLPTLLLPLTSYKRVKMEKVSRGSKRRAASNLYQVGQPGLPSS